VNSKISKVMSRMSIVILCYSSGGSAGYFHWNTPKSHLLKIPERICGNANVRALISTVPQEAYALAFVHSCKVQSRAYKEIGYRPARKLGDIHHNTESGKIFKVVSSFESLAAFLYAALP
jgi:hypothetical protein